MQFTCMNRNQTKTEVKQLRDLAVLRCMCGRREPAWRWRVCLEPRWASRSRCKTHWRSLQRSGSRRPTLSSPPASAPDNTALETAASPHTRRPQTPADPANTARDSNSNLISTRTSARRLLKITWSGKHPLCINIWQTPVRCQFYIHSNS